MKLSDTKLRALKTPGKYFDGNGLYVEVTKTGAKSFRFKFRYFNEKEGKRKEARMIFGLYPAVTLSEARAKAAQVRAGLHRVRAPEDFASAAEPQRREEALTFEAVAREWIQYESARPARRGPGLNWSERTRGLVTSSLERDAFPVLGSRPIAAIRPKEVSEIAQAVEARGATETANRLLGRIKAVFQYAILKERIASNPMLNLQPRLVLRGHAVRHRAAMNPQDLPGFLRALADYRGEPAVVLGLRLLMLTAVRPGELRGAHWAEFDLAGAIWRIPAERTKMHSEHVVPLSRQALAVLAQVEQVTGRGQLVFPSPYYPGSPMSENTLNSALARMGFKGSHSAHGFRALFSTVCNEHGHDPDVIELHLAHVERNKVRAAYNRSKRMADRASLVQWYADWVDAQAARSAA